MSPADTADLLHSALTAVDALIKRQHLNDEEAIDLVADVLDVLTVLPEPAESAADVLIDERLAPVIVEALRRDPAKMQLRAERAKIRGNWRRANRIEERIAKIEARD